MADDDLGALAVPLAIAGLAVAAGGAILNAASQATPLSGSVDSSWINSYSYDPSSQDFTVNLKKGQSYIYNQVPRSTVQAFVNAPSKGQFLNAEIKSKYGFRLA